MKKHLTFIFMMTSILSHSQLNWVSMPNIEPSRFSPSSFIIGSKFYVSNGQDSANNLLSDLFEYDLNTNTWTNKASLPTGVALYADKGFALNGMGYITCGGTPGSGYENILYQYNPQTNSWATKAPFPGTARYTACQFTIGNYAYVGLGFSPYYNDLYRYDPLSDSWTQMVNFPGTARQSVFCFVIGGSAYIGMGSDGNTNNPSDFYRFDTTGIGVWTQLNSFPGTPRNSGASFAFNGHGYIMCGTNANATQMFDDIWEYYPQTDSWTQIGTFPGGARREVAYANYDSILIIGDGAVNDGNNLTSTFWKTCFGNGCFPAGIETVNTSPAINCYPSPNSGSFYINMGIMGNGEKLITIYNQLGQTVYSTVTTENKALVANHFLPGIYTVNVNCGGQHSMAKVVITE